MSQSSPKPYRIEFSDVLRDLGERLSRSERPLLLGVKWLRGIIHGPGVAVEHRRHGALHE